MSDFKQLYLQNGYFDCIEMIEMVLEKHYCCITSNSAVGLSTFLSTLQYFLDKAYDMRYIFDQLHISNSSNYEKYLN